MVHYFKEDLKRGQIGEKLFYRLNSQFLIRTNGHKEDFILRSNPKIKLELKTDYYDMTRTKNFFIERWSDMDARKCGGPWQSFQNRVDWYVYWFLKNKVAFYFKTDPLVDRLGNLLKKRTYKFVMIENNGYITGGYKIPRKDLSVVLEYRKEFK